MKIGKNFRADALGLVARLESLLNFKSRLDPLDFDKNRQEFPGNRLDESLHLRCQQFLDV